MAVRAPPVQVVTSGAPPFVQVPSGAPPFVAVSGNAPPIMIVASGAPPITLFNEDGSLWAGGGPAVPVNTVPPVISGSPVVGQLLTTTYGTWTNSPTDFINAWMHDGAAIPGAIGINPWRLKSESLGKMIQTLVGAQNAAGASAGTTGSNLLGPVTAPPGGAGLLMDETDGFATDFLYPPGTQEQVAVKVANVVTNYARDSFYQNAGTSPKQVWDVAGALGWSPHNMCLQSQTFNVASWSIPGTITIAGDVIAAPDGTLTAEKMAAANATSSFHSMPTAIAIANVVGETYTLSVYAKAAEYNWFGIEHNNTNANLSYFDLTNGVLGTKAAFHTNSTITSVGNGWYRCSITYVAAAASYAPTFHIVAANNGASFAAVAGSGLYVWGAQLNRGSVALAYLPTTTAARFGLALDYDPVTHAAKGLLCEPAATNLQIQSQDQSNASWTTTAGTVARDVIAPNGALEGTTYTETTTSATHAILPAGGARPTLAATTNTFSIFLKAGTRRYVNLGPENAGNGFSVTVDTQTWAITNTATTGTGWVYMSSALQAVGGGWYRLSITGTTPAIQVIIFIQGCTVAAGGRSETYMGTGATIITWGAQIETGSVATSLIPTFAASATRAVDQYKITPAQINYSATAGNWWVSWNQIRLVSPGQDRIIGYTSSYAPIYCGTNTNLCYDGPVISVSSLVGVGNHKVAMAFQSGDRAISADNNGPTTDATAGINLGTPGAEIGIGSAIGGGQSANGWIKQIRYLPRRPINADLKASTL